MSSHMKSNLPMPLKSVPANKRRHVLISNRRFVYLQKFEKEYLEGKYSSVLDPQLLNKNVRNEIAAEQRGKESDDTHAFSSRILAELDEKEYNSLRSESLANDAENIFAPENVAELGDLLKDLFVMGLDSDFDYDEVDYNSEYDDNDLITRDLEETYFQEDPPGDAHLEDNLKCQTGVQDF
ncbi:hypothetical protein NEOLI_003332 [Neolecta irregularis DAH-3]|uniref:CCD97-like C-terminal domain-containing protein n=1 Tax=Neolecta irregularis (strain DAH-3) TaxID=1198029 RepID=A0A1U7LGZ9_NEOID|nr:hypothetical protein NEOLI_003332 [Neolecta irregularis DAH-3]|eukprot:OLL21924.1 hypothetical protein NEOLI_003332 [Neolecta irregularis DAH-3]